MERYASLLVCEPLEWIQDCGSEVEQLSVQVFQEQIVFSKQEDVITNLEKDCVLKIQISAQSMPNICRNRCCGVDVVIADISKVPYYNHYVGKCYQIILYS